MKLFNTVLTLTLLIKFLQAERNRSYEDYQAKRATQQPLEAPKMNSPTKYKTVRINTSNAPYTDNDNLNIIHSLNPKTGIITSTTATSKYTPEQLNDMYKINPYTNL